MLLIYGYSWGGVRYFGGELFFFLYNAEVAATLLLLIKYMNLNLCRSDFSTITTRVARALDHRLTDGS